MDANTRSRNRFWLALLGALFLALPLLPAPVLGGTITPSVTNPAGGTISPSTTRTYSNTSRATYTFTPRAGYAIGSIRVDNVTVLPVRSSYVFNPVGGNRTISVTFALDADNDGFADYLDSPNNKPQGEVDFTPMAPDKKDLFVILRDAEEMSPNDTRVVSLLPDDPLAFLDLPGLVAHRLVRPGEESRQVSQDSSEFAVRVTEDSSSPLDDDRILGVSKYGTPNYHDDATVYTRRIKEWIDRQSSGAGKVCLNGAANCWPDNQMRYDAWIDEIRATYTRHTIAHEIGHMIRLTSTYNASLGGYHYASSETGTMMEQSVFYTTDRAPTGAPTRVTWYLPVHFHTNDAPALK